MNREKLTLHVKHHGLLRTGFVYMLKVLRQLIDLDLMVVETASAGPTGSPVVEPYVTRQITADEYRQGVRSLGEDHERPWAFDREDRCFANLFDSRLVGYQFYAKQITMIRDGLAFGFPDSLTYAYASFTHRDHRGRGLAQSRAIARRHADRALGILLTSLFIFGDGLTVSRAIAHMLSASALLPLTIYVQTHYCPVKNVNR